MARRWLLFVGLAFVGSFLTNLATVEAQVWVHDITGAGDDASWPGKVALTPDGGVVSVGSLDTTVDPGTFLLGQDMVIAKLDPATGSEVWRATYSGLAGGDDYLRSVAVDAAGDIVGGGQVDDGNRGDYAVIKVSGVDGSEIWRTSIDGSRHTDDHVDDVAVDANGDVLAVGATINTASGVPTLTIVKLQGSDGATLWRKDFAGFTNGWTITGATLTVGSAGEAIVGFAGYDEAIAQPYFSVVKLTSSDGSTAWRYDHAAGSHCEVRDVAVNAVGEVVAAGTCASFSTYGLIVARIDGTSGAEVWLRDLYGGGEPNEGSAFGVAIDSQGDVIVSGLRDTDFENLKFLVAKFDGATGAQEWQQAILGDYGPASIAFDVAVDSHDDVIAVGEIDNSPIYAKADLAAVKFAGSDGSVVWRQQFAGYPGPGGRFLWLALDGDGDAYAVGNRYSWDETDPPESIVVAKFDNEMGGPVTLPGDVLRMRDSANPAKKSLVIGSRSGSVSAMPSASSDPRDTGATLKITNPATGESTSLRLPAAGWVPSGGPKAAKGFVYRDAGKSRGPCQIVRLRKGHSLKISCKGAGIDFSLDEASQGALRVELITGPLRQCMQFGGVVADAPGTFIARKAVRPTSCD